MDSKEFTKFRKKLNKTQKQMANLLGVSIKAIHSYEQGWRTIPPHVERQMFFLMARKRGISKIQKPCWTVKKCPTKQKKECPAWEFQSGKLCWFINGTVCCGTAHNKWKEKMKLCRSCEVLAPIMWSDSCHTFSYHFKNGDYAQGQVRQGRIKHEKLLASCVIFRKTESVSGLWRMSILKRLATHL